MRDYVQARLARGRRTGRPDPRGPDGICGTVNLDNGRDFDCEYLIDGRRNEPPELAQGREWDLRSGRTVIRDGAGKRVGMLQNTAYSAERVRQPEGSPPQKGGLGDVLAFAASFMRRRYLTLCAVCGLGPALAVAYLCFTPPTYTAAAQVLLDNPKAQYVKQESPLAEPGVDLAQIETQIQIIRSPAIATAVIRHLDLASDPEFAGGKWSLGSAWRYVRGRFASAADADEQTAYPIAARIRRFLDRLEARRVGFGNIREIDCSAGRAARAADQCVLGRDEPGRTPAAGPGAR